MAYQLSDDDVLILRQMREWQKRWEGPNSNNTPNGASFGASGPWRRPRRTFSIASLPTPQYQDMMLGAPSANTLGAMFVAAVSAIPTT